KAAAPALAGELCCGEQSRLLTVLLAADVLQVAQTAHARGAVRQVQPAAFAKIAVRSDLRGQPRDESVGVEARLVQRPARRSVAALERGKGEPQPTVDHARVTTAGAAADRVAVEHQRL